MRYYYSIKIVVLLKIKPQRNEARVDANANIGVKYYVISIKFSRVQIDKIFSAIIKKSSQKLQIVAQLYRIAF